MSAASRVPAECSSASRSIASRSLRGDKVRPAKRADRPSPSISPLSSSSSISSRSVRTCDFCPGDLCAEPKGLPLNPSTFLPPTSASPNTASGMARGSAPRIRRNAAPASATTPLLLRINMASVRGSGRTRQRLRIRRSRRTALPARKYAIVECRLAELLEQTERSAAPCLVAEVLQRLPAARGIDRDRGQKLTKLARGTLVKRNIGPARQSRDLSEGALGFRVTTLMEDEHGHLHQSQFAGKPGEPVDILLHAVAHIDQRVHFGALAFAPGMGKDFGDLRQAALAGDVAHQLGQRDGVRNPFRRLALVEPAEIDKLHIAPADSLDGVEHVGLKLESEVPGGLPAHGGVHGEDQPAAAGCGGGRGFYSFEKRIDLRTGRLTGGDLAARALGRRLGLRHLMAPPAPRVLLGYKWTLARLGQCREARITRRRSRRREDSRCRLRP